MQQRRSNDVKHRERPATVGSHGAREGRRSDYQRMTAQRSEGSLQYSSLNRGVIFNRDDLSGSVADPAASLSLAQRSHQQQQGGEWAPRPFSPSGSRPDMRSPVSDEMNDAYDSLERYHGNGFIPGPGEHQRQLNYSEEQR